MIGWLGDLWSVFPHMCPDWTGTGADIQTVSVGSCLAPAGGKTAWLARLTAGEEGRDDISTDKDDTGPTGLYVHVVVGDEDIFIPVFFNYHGIRSSASAISVLG